MCDGILHSEQASCLSVNLPYLLGIWPRAVWSEMVEQSHFSSLNCFLHSFFANLAPSRVLPIRATSFRQISRCLELKSLCTSHNERSPRPRLWNNAASCPSMMLLFTSTDLKEHKIVRMSGEIPLTVSV